MRLGLLQTGKGRPCDGVFAGRERTQAERAVEILVWSRAAILFWSAPRGVVDKGYAGSRGDAVAGAEDGRLARRRKRHRRSARYATVSREAVSAQIVEHAEAAVSVGVSDRNRLRDIGEPVAWWAGVGGAISPLVWRSAQRAGLPAKFSPAPAFAGARSAQPWKTLTRV